LIGRWGHLITTWRAALTVERAAAYATAIAGKDAPLQTCVGFIDGTLIRIARPGLGLQHVCYSGHKRCHAIKFQSICTPDGLLFQLLGPVEGRRPDMLLYHESGIDAQLEATLLIDETQFCIYGHSPYIIRAWIQRGYGAWPDGDAEEQAHDGAMNSLREAVEWGFREVKQQFTSLDFKRKLKICETSVGAQYLSGALLWNMRSCFYGNQMSTYFDCAAPSIEITCSANKTDMGTALLFYLPQARVREMINRQSYRIRATSEKLSGEQVPNSLFFSSMQSRMTYCLFLTEKQRKSKQLTG